MSGKKKQRNGFFFFMLDMREEMRREGKNVPMGQMSALAGPKWSKLPEAEKANYNLRAKHEKRTGIPVNPTLPPRHGPGRMDCIGELLSERRDPVAELEERRRRQAEDLRTFLTSPRDAIHRTFYLLDIQPLCELKELQSDRWLPCEMAVSAYSLVHGIQHTFHTFIYPGPIPMGYRYEAVSQSERTHMIPPEGNVHSNKDYRQILRQLQSFITSCGNGAHETQPLVLAKRDLNERVEYQLNWMATKAGVELFIEQVYDLELLLMHLDLLSNPNNCTMLTVYQASDLFNTSSYDYERNIRCDLHEKLENKFCSLSTVKIYSFVMSDNLCEKYSINITPAHLPEQPEQPAGIVIPPVVPRLQVPRGVVTQEMPAPMVFGRGRGRGLSGKPPPTVRQPKCAAQSMK